MHPERSGLQSEEDIINNLPELERKKLEAHIASGDPKAANAKKQDILFLLSKKDETLEIKRDAARKTQTLYLKNLENCIVTIKSRCAKLLIENCPGCKFYLDGMIITNMVEIWHASNSELHITTKVSTIQADLSKNLWIDFKDKSLMYQVVWSAVQQLKLTFQKKEEQEFNYETGFDEMVKQFAIDEPNMVLKEEGDQFVIRFLEGKIKCEQIVRLPGGFPTTEREAQAFDEKKKLNDAILEDEITKMIKVSEKKFNVDSSNKENEKQDQNEKQNGSTENTQEQVPEDTKKSKKEAIPKLTKEEEEEKNASFLPPNLQPKKKNNNNNNNKKGRARKGKK